MIINNTQNEAIISAISDLTAWDSWTSKTIRIYKREDGKWIVEQEQKDDDD